MRFLPASLFCIRYRDVMATRLRAAIGTWALGSALLSAALMVLSASSVWVALRPPLTARASEDVSFENESQKLLTAVSGPAISTGFELTDAFFGNTSTLWSTHLSQPFSTPTPVLPTPTPIPGLTEWGLGALALLLVAVALWRVARPRGVARP